MRIYCDIWGGQLRKSIEGGVLGSLNFFLRDIIPLEIVFVDGNVPVTSSVLAASALLKVGIKARPGAAQILALSSEYTLNDEVAVMQLSLNTAELLAYFTSNVSAGMASANLQLEIEVTAADESTRQTYHQSQCVVRREVNVSSDTEPSAAAAPLYVLKSALFDGNGRGISPFYVAFRGEIASRNGGGGTALDGIVTTNLTVPFCVIVRISGTGEIWALVAGTDAEDGTFVVRPDDYDGVTNAKVWIRIL